MNDGLDGLAATVAEVEARTQAELVVVVARRSDGYEDVPLRVAIVAGLVMLVAVIFVPWTFPEWSVLLLVAGAGIAAGWVAERRDDVARALTTVARREEEVLLSAAAAFQQEAVAGTRARTGVLVYVSRLERMVAVVPDVGVTPHLPPGELCTLLGGRVAKVSDGEVAPLLRRLGVVLAERLPASGDNPNELPDAPRERP